MKNKTILFALLCFVACALSRALAQQDSTTNTQQAQFEISEQSFLKKSNFELTPKTPVFEYVEVESVEKLDIQTENWLEEETTVLPSFSKPIFHARINEQALPLIRKRYPNYLKGGFGNYITPLLEGFYTLNPSEYSRYGAFVRHISSKQGVKDKQNSGYGNTSMSLFSMHQFARAELTTKINYELERAHYYGYAKDLVIPTPKNIRQTYHRLESTVRFRSVKTFSLEDTQKFGYDISSGFNLIRATPQVSEMDIPLQTQLSYEFNKKFSLFWTTNANYTTLSDTVKSVSRAFVVSSPSVNFTFDKLTSNIGVGIAYSNNGSLSKKQSVFVYPNISLSYQVLKDNIWVIASLTGGIESQFFRTQSRLNPFLSPLQELSHAFKAYDAKIGIQSKLLENLEINGNLSLASYQNLAFFAPALSDSSQFTLVYDDSRIFSLNIVSNYQKKNVDVRFSASYFGYKLNNLAVAHHRPNIETHLVVGHKATEKLRLEVSLSQFFGLKTQNLVSKTTYRLASIHHVNAEISYQITPKISAFAAGYNLVGTSYQRFLNYPVNGLTALVGGKFVF